MTCEQCKEYPNGDCPYNIKCSELDDETMQTLEDWFDFDLYELNEE